MYEVTTDEVAQQQIDALPAEALAAFTEVRVVLEVAPWNGTPYHRSKPDTPIRRMVFGATAKATSCNWSALEPLRRVSRRRSPRRPNQAVGLDAAITDHDPLHRYSF